MDKGIKGVATATVCTASAYFLYRACCYSESACGLHHGIRLRHSPQRKRQTDLDDILEEALSATIVLTRRSQDSHELHFSRNREYEIDYSLNTEKQRNENEDSVEDSEVRLRPRSFVEMLSSVPQNVATAVRDRASHLRSSLGSAFGPAADQQENGIEQEELVERTERSNVGDSPDGNASNESRFWVFRKFRIPSWNSRRSKMDDQENVEIRVEISESKPLSEAVVFEENSTSETAAKRQEAKAPAADTSSASAAASTQDRKERLTDEEVEKAARKPVKEQPSSKSVETNERTSANRNTATQQVSDSAPISNVNAKSPEKPTNANADKKYTEVEATEQTMQLSDATLSLESAENAINEAEVESMSTETETVSSETTYRKISFDEYLLFLSIAPATVEIERREHTICSPRDVIIMKAQIQPKVQTKRS